MTTTYSMDDEREEQLPLLTLTLGWRCPYCESWLPDWPYASGRNDHCDPTPVRLTDRLRLALEKEQ